MGGSPNLRSRLISHIHQKEKQIPSTNWRKKVATGTFFGLSIVAATTRTLIRLHSQRRLFFDDYMLIFACINLIAAQVLLHVMKSSVYLVEGMIFNPDSDALASMSKAELMDRILVYRKLVFAYLVLTWTTIFAVKICFLSFFRQMLKRLKRMMLTWKIIFVLTLLFYGICVSGPFLYCPYFGLDSCKSTLHLRD